MIATALAAGHKRLTQQDKKLKTSNRIKKNIALFATVSQKEIMIGIKNPKATNATTQQIQKSNSKQKRRPFKCAKLSTTRKRSSPNSIFASTVVSASKVSFPGLIVMTMLLMTASSKTLALENVAKSSSNTAISVSMPASETQNAIHGANTLRLPMNLIAVNEPIFSPSSSSAQPLSAGVVQSRNLANESDDKLDLISADERAHQSTGSFSSSSNKVEQQQQQDSFQHNVNNNEFDQQQQQHSASTSSNSDNNNVGNVHSDSQDSGFEAEYLIGGERDASGAGDLPPSDSSSLQEQQQLSTVSDESKTSDPATSAGANDQSQKQHQQEDARIIVHQPSSKYNNNLNMERRFGFFKKGHNQQQFGYPMMQSQSSKFAQSAYMTDCDRCLASMSVSQQQAVDLQAIEPIVQAAPVQSPLIPASMAQASPQAPSVFMPPFSSPSLKKKLFPKFPLFKQVPYSGNEGGFGGAGSAIHDNMPPMWQHYAHHQLRSPAQASLAYAPLRASSYNCIQTSPPFIANPIFGSSSSNQDNGVNSKLKQYPHQIAYSNSQY